MLARLLDGRGELRRLGFDCAGCKKDKKLHAARGCGKTPLPLSAKSPQWNVDAFLAEALKKNLTEDGTKQAAHSRYTWADVGQVSSLLGSFWDWCPAWYARFFEGRLAVEADAAVDLAVAIKKGFGPLVVNGGRAWLASEIKAAMQAQTMMDVLAAEDQRREIEQQQQKNKTNRR